MEVKNGTWENNVGYLQVDLARISCFNLCLQCSILSYHLQIFNNTNVVSSSINHFNFHHKLIDTRISLSFVYLQEIVFRMELHTHTHTYTRGTAFHWIGKGEQAL